MGIGSLFLAIAAFLAWIYESHQKKHLFMISATSMMVLSLFTILLNVNGSVYFAEINFSLYLGIILIYVYAFVILLRTHIDFSVISAICIVVLTALILSRIETIYIGFTAIILIQTAVVLFLSKNAAEGIAFSVIGGLFFNFFRQLQEGNGIVLGSAAEFVQVVFSIIFICCYFMIVPYTREYVKGEYYVSLDKREAFTA